MGKMTIKAPSMNISPITLEGGQAKVKLDQISIVRGPVDVEETNMEAKISVVVSVEEA